MSFKKILKIATIYIKAVRYLTALNTHASMNTFMGHLHMNTFMGHLQICAYV